MTKNSLRIAFDRCVGRLYGGDKITVDGEVGLMPPTLSLLTGRTGSGKTMVLAFIAQYLAVPAFRAVKKLQQERVGWRGTSVSSSHLGIVRQNPSENFLGSSIGEEFELAFTLSRLEEPAFRAKLEYYWSNYFNLEIALLYRQPSKLSSGQQQILALLSQILRDPDLLLADEPLARLSLGNAESASQLLVEAARSSFVLASSHEDSLELFRDLPPETYSLYRVEEAASTITLGEGGPIVGLTDSIEAERLEDVLISGDSYAGEKLATADFSQLPVKAPRLISGSGESLTVDALNIDVYTGYQNGPTIAVRGLSLNRGINILYGDNGAGKTLLGRSLGGDLVFNPRFLWLRSLYSQGVNAKLHPRIAGPEIPAGATLKWLQKHRHTHFLSSNPAECLAGGQLVADEVGFIYGNRAVLAARLEFLEALGITSDREVDSLSFGQSKLVAFSLLPEQCSLLILDELFANFSEAEQRAVADFTIQKARSGDWPVVVLSSNRPRYTLARLLSVTEE